MRALNAYFLATAILAAVTGVGCAHVSAEMDGLSIDDPYASSSSAQGAMMAHAVAKRGGVYSETPGGGKYMVIPVSSRVSASYIGGMGTTDYRYREQAWRNAMTAAVPIIPPRTTVIVSAGSTGGDERLDALGREVGEIKGVVKTIATAVGDHLKKDKEGEDKKSK